VIVLSCVACGFALALAARNVPTGALNSTFGPQITTTQFCAAEASGDYVGAYELFSTQLQQQWTQQQWSDANQAREQSNGDVRNCEILSGGDAHGADTVNVQLQLMLNDGQHTGSLQLVNQDGAWVIDMIDTALGLT